MGQATDPTGPFYVATSSNLIDASASHLLVYTSDDAEQVQRVAVVDRSSGRARGRINFDYTSFPYMIKLDAHSNILVRACDANAPPPLAAASLIKYFDTSGALLLQISELALHRAPLHRDFSRFNRIDLNQLDGDDQLICFSKQDGIILFF